MIVPFSAGVGADPKFAEILKFTEWDSHQHPFRVEGNEVVVDTTT